MSKRIQLITLLAGCLLLATAAVATAFYQSAVVAVVDDPTVRMPGTQPNQVSLEGPKRCLNCHAGYDSAVEPGHNWQGSMMAQSARDFLFFSAMTVAAQDAIWATGSANATDLCLRCHFPKGWLEGRSEATNASLMAGDDYDGVQCDFCHRMWDPHFEATAAGTREGSDWTGYWDETNASTTPSSTAAGTTLTADATEAQDILQFNGNAFFVNDEPFSAQYTEATSGQYYVAADGSKRAPFADADPRHALLYSRFHKSKYMCGTCHDVSNAVLANLGQDGSQPLTSETDAAHSYFHVERTFSEFMLSDYGQQGGAAGIGPFAPDQLTTSHPDNAIATCQDCHMRDVVGVAADMNGAVLRPTDSTEHPKSGQPLHDLTGGNAWVSAVLASAVSGSPHNDATNDALLNQPVSAITLDLGAGQGIDPVALLDGADRALQNLQDAASINQVGYDPASGTLSFQVQNQTGHKLISGFPEGRRMFVNIQAFAGGQLIYEVNPYDPSAATLKGLSYSPNSPALGANEAFVDELVYEMHPSSTLTGEAETLHFVLADGRYKDNRIPPRGFRIDAAADRLSQPVWHGTDAPDYFTAAEYAGGYDAVTLTLPTGADRVTVQLYYQTTSREYIEFLRDEINGTGNLTLSDPGVNGGPAYIVQDDPFFTQLKAWGDTIWQLWDHNKHLPGAAPVLMTAAAWDSPCSAAVAPTVSAARQATPANSIQLTWLHDSVNDHYAVWRSSVPYFWPADSGSTLLNDAVTTPAFVDEGVLAQPGSAHYYAVEGVNACGGTAAVGSHVGSITFAIQAGTP